MSNIVVPELGESVVEARVARWLKKPGDHVDVGEPIVELETEKIDLEVSADRAGVIASIARQEGDDVKIGEVLGVVEDGAAAAPKSPAKAEPQPRKGADAPAAAKPSQPPVEEMPRATPTAQRIARDHDVNLGSVHGSGPGGLVTKQDVRGAIAAPSAPASPARPAPATGAAPPSRTATAPARSAEPPPAARPIQPGQRSERRVRMSKRRQTIARRLVEAQRTAAMLTTFNEIDMSALMSLRERHKEAFKKQHGVGLGIASFFVRASISALRQFPQLNAEIQGDEIVFKDYYDIGMAVGAEGGLVVPVIRDADRLSFAGTEQTIRDFAARAANGTLTLEDLSGGTFTITNGGVFGSLMSTPILNPPQVGILGLHKIEDRAVPAGAQVVIRPMMYVALSYDHRIVDGREAVQFLVKIKELIEDPAAMLIEN
jgi:2-oxoglutarate dehydrogenase E2 component (dihydrolipoamide succinyltransferase)